MDEQKLAERVAEALRPIYEDVLREVVSQPKPDDEHCDEQLVASSYINDALHSALRLLRGE